MYKVTDMPNTPRETLTTFTARVDAEIAAQLAKLKDQVANLEALRVIYRDKLEHGARANDWTYSGDFGRINGTLGDVLETMEWIPTIAEAGR